MEPSEIQIPDFQASQETEAISQPSSDDSLANPFLEGVEESDREIVGKYINDWDGQVTQKFQELRGELKPYQELGVDIDSIQHAVRVMQWADQDPVGFYQEVQNTIKQMQESGTIDMGILDDDGSQMPPDSGSNLPEFDGVPSEFVERYQKLESRLEDLDKWKEEQVSSKETETRQQQLDNLLSDLENEHGRFDKQAIMGRLLEGMEPKAAVEDWKKMMKDFNSPERKTPPPVLNPGQVIADQVDSSKIRNDKKARTGLVTDLLKTIDS